MDDFETRTRRTMGAAEYAAGWVAVFIFVAVVGGGFLLAVSFR
jgi:hypothetical protein